VNICFYRYISSDIGCELLSHIFGVAMQPYEAYFRNLEIIKSMMLG